MTDKFKNLPKWDGIKRLDNLANVVLGTEHPIYNIYFKKWLVSAVKRALDPGCKVDTVLILQGGQGIGKTTLFEILGGEFYTTFGHSTSDKDAIIKLQGSHIVDWSELDAIFGKKDMSTIK